MVGRPLVALLRGSTGNRSNVVAMTGTPRSKRIHARDV